MPQSGRSVRNRFSGAKDEPPRSKLATLWRLVALSMLVGLLLLSIDFTMGDGIVGDTERMLARAWNEVYRAVKFFALCLGIGAAIVLPLWLLRRYRLARSVTRLTLTQPPKPRSVQAATAAPMGTTPTAAGVPAAKADQQRSQVTPAVSASAVSAASSAQK